MKKANHLVESALALALAAATASAADGPLPPNEALKSFDLEPGLRAELVAAEPLTADPCALAWDEQGRLFVVENRGYPLGGPDGQPMGIIALLEDTDGDERLDKRTEFAAGLTYPNGVMPWRGGLIVTCAPDVLYFKDTDGDGKADVKEVLLTGFATNLSTQLRVNAPVLAPDGWVYLASGLSAGKVTSPKRPEQAALDLKGDLRFKPDTGEFEPADGKAQFGQSFDDFGRRFGVFNRVQVQHFVLPSRYVSRNPRLTFGEVLQNCPELLDNPLMRGGGGAARIFPISANVTTADSHAGTFSAACAIHLYRGGSLPAEYLGHAFSCDPTGNLVHHDRLEPDGATFTAKRVRDNAEFLRSRDNWFRPCFLATGPDGALYVADMYRKVIEHPEYLPEEVRKHVDFDAGKGMGRIWRVTAASSAISILNFQFPVSNARGLLRELNSPNTWRRDTAFRLLVERNDPSDIPPLKRAIRKYSSPAAAAARLHLLAVLGGLDDPTLATALRSTRAGIREVALRLAETRLADSPKLREEALRLANDPDSRVRFQCALALGPADSKEAIEAIATVALRGAEDRWTRAAILSSVPVRDNQQLPFLAALLASKPSESKDLNALLRDLSRMITGATAGSALPSFLDWLLEQSAASGFLAQAAVVDGFAEAARNAKVPGDGPVLLRLAPETTGKLLRSGRDIAASNERSLEVRVMAVQLLAHGDSALAAVTLISLLRTNASPELQIAAIRALADLDDAKAASALLDATLWPGYSPALRETVLVSLLSRPRHGPSLLAALESGALPVNALNPARREQLKKSKDDSLRQRAERLFSTVNSSDRMKAFEEAKTALALKAAPTRGKEVFTRACANCHRLEGEGYAVGPDLFDIRNQPKEAILLHIVLPEYEIAPNFANYTCETRDGRTLSGILVADTPAGITLRQGLGQEETVARSNIASLTASARSLMPQELEKGITWQEMADLLAYLRGER